MYFLIKTLIFVGGGGKRTKLKIYLVYEKGKWLDTGVASLYKTFFSTSPTPLSLPAPLYPELACRTVSRYVFLRF